MSTATLPAPSLRDDAKVIGSVSTAHGFSHFCQMMLPPLFPVLKEAFGLSYSELGLVTAIFFAVSGLMQTVAGFAVDRFGPRAMLVFGVVFISLGLLVTSLASSFSMLVAGAVIGGMGNCMFHPADMALLNAKIDPKRLGPAFSLHNIGGFLGFVVGPLFVVSLSALLGWRWAIGAGAVLGLIITIVLITQSALHTERIARPRPSEGVATSDTGLLLSTPILMCFGYFTLQAMASVGFMTFSPTAAAKLYEIPLVAAAGVLTAFFAGTIAGTLAGGIGAARTTQHGTVAVCCMVSAAIALACMSTGILPMALLLFAAALFGFSIGFANPSRDIMVRAVTPPHARGKVYGFVYSGMDVGSAIVPYPLGWLLDHGYSGAIFAFGAICLALALPTVLTLRHSTRAAAAG